jgi:predicted nucleic acid-binding protein
MLLDSNILIAYLKGEPSIVETLSRWKQEARALVISSISVAEVLALPALTPSDIQIVTRFLRTFLSIPFDDRLAETAIDHGLPLVTRDRTFRKIPELHLREI